MLVFTLAHLCFLCCRDCAECKAFHSGPLKENCTDSCSHVNVTKVKDFESLKKDTKDWCSEKDMTFLVTNTDNEDYVYIHIREKQGNENSKNLLPKSFANHSHPTGHVFQYAPEFEMRKEDGGVSQGTGEDLDSIV